LGQADGTELRTHIRDGSLPHCDQLLRARRQRRDALPSGLDHTFFVVEGECTIKGLKDGEEHKLTQHQGVHIAAGYFYQLNNTGPERLILYQVSTEANPRPKITKVVYGIDTSLKEHLLGRLSEQQP
jgi:hypothetical protein